jgi:hypothetical protein
LIFDNCNIETDVSLLVDQHWATTETMTMSQSSERFELCSEEAETLLDQVEASIEQLNVAKQKGKVQGEWRILLSERASTEE